MTIFRVSFPSGFTKIVHAADEGAAMEKAYRAAVEPIYCRIHEEIADRSDAPAGRMGFYTPKSDRPTSAERMVEVYSGGGYCVVPAA